MEIINSKFYDGFEGYPEIHFTYKTKEQVNRLVIWEGYFEALLSACFSEDIQEGGLLHSYRNADGFYDESLWRIPRIDIVIEELSLFKKEEIQSDSDNMISIVESLNLELLSFLTEAQKRGLEVYIDYN